MKFLALSATVFSLALVPAVVYAQDGAPDVEKSQSYTTLQSVTVTPLSNGIQIKLAADGLLQFQRTYTEDGKLTLSFPDARNGTGRTSGTSGSTR